MFFHASDDKLNFHPARDVTFFEKGNFFVSKSDGSLYKFGTSLTTYDYATSVNSTGEEIPRIRICKSTRKKNTKRFKATSFTFSIEQGMPNKDTLNKPRVDFSFSKNGNQSFSNIVGKELNAIGKYRNQLSWHRLGGECNEFTVQLRFWGFTRFAVNNGILEIS